ncbi:MAG: ATP-binding protein, partial [candidate division Zixibacteria bacterium]|nr:ATP-binding protein [candidate division Zixibacteria bacterium]
DEIIGKGWEHFPFKDLIPFEGILSGRQSQGEIESSFDTPLGKKVLLANISRLYDEQGQMTGAVAVIFDYTRIKELEESARRKERLTELGDLAAGVAHEIRNPLNGISIAAQRLMAEFEPQNNAEEFRFFAGQVKSEAGRLNEIVSRFLAMAKGKTEGHGQINASKIIASTLELLRLSAEEKDILIKSEIEPEILLNGAEDRLKQMIINLVKNGIEACGSQGGTIRVRLYREGVRSILSISDTGQGIPEEIKKKIFTPYFTTKEYGTGLGLSIVYQIVEEFGGQIGVLSPPKGGTEFRIIFTKQG